MLLVLDVQMQWAETLAGIAMAAPSYLGFQPRPPHQLIWLLRPDQVVELESVPPGPVESRLFVNEANEDHRLFVERVLAHIEQSYPRDSMVSFFSREFEVTNHLKLRRKSSPLFMWATSMKRLTDDPEGLGSEHAQQFTRLVRSATYAAEQTQAAGRDPGATSLPQTWRAPRPSPQPSREPVPAGAVAPERVVAAVVPPAERTPVPWGATIAAVPATSSLPAPARPRAAPILAAPMFPVVTPAPGPEAPADVGEGPARAAATPAEPSPAKPRVEAAGEATPSLRKKKNRPRKGDVFEEITNRQGIGLSPAMRETLCDLLDQETAELRESGRTVTLYQLFGSIQGRLRDVELTESQRRAAHTLIKRFRTLLIKSRCLVDAGGQPSDPRDPAAQIAGTVAGYRDLLEETTAVIIFSESKEIDDHDTHEALAGVLYHNRQRFEEARELIHRCRDKGALHIDASGQIGRGSPLSAKGTSGLLHQEASEPAQGRIEPDARPN